MEEKIKKIIAEVLCCEIGIIKPSHFLSIDLGADDLDIVEIIMSIEKDYKISIPDNFIGFIDSNSITVQNLIDITNDSTKVDKTEAYNYLDSFKETKVRPPSKKTIKKRAIKFTEYTYDDGSVSIKPSVKGFNDMELIGLLHYYLDLFTVNTIRGNAKQN